MRALLVALLVAQAPTPSPDPVIVPGPGIYRPDWQELDPKAPTPAPVKPEGLPHYVGLGPTERKLAEQLYDMMGLAEGQLAANRLASARITLERADELVQAAERDHLVLRLHADWQRPRVRLLDLQARYKQARAGAIDPESRQLAEAAAKRISAQLDALAPAKTPQEASRRLDAARRAVAAAGADPYLVDNPAWAQARLPVLERLGKIEREVGLRVGQIALAEAIARMAALKRSADARLAADRFEDALGDLAALEEACLGFRHDLAELVALGYDAKGLVWIGPEGTLAGPAFLARVAAWQAEGAHRWDVVERARARARLRDEAPLEPPTPPSPPPLPPRRGAS